MGPGDGIISLLVTLQDKFSPTLGKLEAGVNKVATGMNGLRSALGPLTSGLAAFAGAAAGALAMSKSLEMAKAAVESENRLLAALRGRTEEQKRILALTSRMQVETREEDDALNDLAATMLNVGVAAKDVEGFLRASVDIAAALGLETKTVGQELARISEGGEARMLGRFVPELKKMKEEGASAVEQVDFLMKKFSGQEAQLAVTTFGRITQLENLIGDEAERVGKTFAEIKRIILEALLPQVKKFADFMSDPKVVAALKAMAQAFLPILEIVVKVSLAIAGFFALQGLVSVLMSIGSAVAAILAGVLQIAAPLVIIVGLIAAIPGAIQFFMDMFANVSQYISDLRQEFSDTLGDIATGQLGVADLFDLLATRARQFWISFKASVVTPVLEYAKAIANIVEGIFIAVVASLQRAWYSVLAAIELAMRYMVKGVLLAVQGMLNSAIAGINAVRKALGKDPLQLHNFADQFSTDVDPRISAGLAATDKAFAEAADKIFNSMQTAQNNIVNVTFDSQKKLEESEKAFQERRNASYAKHRKDNADADKAAREKALKDIANFEAEITAARAEAARLSQFSAINFSTATGADFRKAAGGHLTDEQRVLLVEALNQRVKEGALGLQEYLEILRQVTTEEFEKQLVALDLEIKANAKIIESLEKKRLLTTRTTEQAVEQREVVGAIRDEMNKQVDLFRRRAELSQKTQTSELKIVQAVMELAKLQQDKADRAKSTFEASNAGTKSSLEAGLIWPSEARAQNEAALQKFREGLQAVQDELFNITATTPAAFKGITDMSAKIAEMQRQTEQGAVPQEGSFWKGLDTGFETTMQNMGDLAKTGASVGQSLASNMAAGLVTLFLEGKAAFKDFLVTFLAGIAQMILQMIIARGIMTALGIPYVPAAHDGGYVQNGTVIKRQRGGYVPGPNVDRDMIPALLAPREFVVRRDAVEHYGLGFMYALNRRRVPKTSMNESSSPRFNARFMGGGEVAAAPSGAASPTPAYIVGDNQAVERLLSGGRDAMMRWMRDNSSDLRGIFQERP